MSNTVFQALNNVLVTNSRDWARTPKDAWLYGIIVGWDAGSMLEISTKFGWDAEAVSDLRALRRQYVKLEMGGGER